MATTAVVAGTAASMGARSAQRNAAAAQDQAAPEAEPAAPEAAAPEADVNTQIEQVQQLAALKDQGILTEAWSPIAQGGVLDDRVITEIAGRVERTPAQVVLRWHLQRGSIVFPKSTTPSRIEENFDVFGFELSAAEMQAIDELDAGERTGPDPDTFARP